ncbi:hypothetical protein BgiMline_021851 [Biomphalaria glabrata]|uniref:Uncharacterized protein LOC106075808 n=1 Tax=Biomphalaria glabrata TaxID=6526 RepID=A0A9W3B837_BIOGL|nr:uncharacterized protein LOC106075808 [Biomphalaria glabrata]
MFLLGIIIYLLSYKLNIVTGQSVAQQCLTEQIRNNNVNNNVPVQQNQVPQNPEGVTLAAFESICRNYREYINCFETRLPRSQNPADRFLQLVFTRHNMENAYEGLCTLDLPTLRDNIRCLLSTPEVRRCYNVFNQGVNEVVNLENRNTVPRLRLEELACNVSVNRYRCETAVYAFCNSRVGQIMQDFFFAGVTSDCRAQTGAFSRYTQLFNGSTKNQTSFWIFALATMLFIFQWKRTSF